MDAGEDVNAANASGHTALLFGLAPVEIVAFLLERGADPRPPEKDWQPPAQWQSEKDLEIARQAETLMAQTVQLVGDRLPAEEPSDGRIDTHDYADDPEVLRLLGAHGYPWEKLCNTDVPAAFGAARIPARKVSLQGFLGHASPRVGLTNPEKVAPAFWLEQMRTGACAYIGAECVLGKAGARNRPSPVWSFERFGRSVTRLPDGRWVLVAGEHEDFYDPDFYIYADVTVLDGLGGVEHYIYPGNAFPPTDFHSAKLVGDDLWLIGTCGYAGTREDSVTQVTRLSTRDWSAKPIVTSGDGPGWIHRHKAVLDGRQIIIRGGKVEPGHRDQTGIFALDLDSLVRSRMACA